MKTVMLPSVFLVTLVSLALMSAAPTTAPTDAQTDAPTTRPTTQQTPHKYALVYKLADGNEKWDPTIRAKIVESMDAAVALYNRYGEFDKTVTANYSPGTPTADANYNGWINFGTQMNKRVALHEIAHTLGVGQHRNWRRLLVDGKWTGEHAAALLKEFDGPDAVLKGDRQHFWPYGLNYDKEWSDQNEVRHVKMVAALREDMGIRNGREDESATAR